MTSFPHNSNLALFHFRLNQHKVLGEYRNDLADGRVAPDQLNWVPLLNRINSELAKQNCAPSQIEQKVHEIRRMIQDYLKRPGG